MEDSETGMWAKLQRQPSSQLFIGITLLLLGIVLHLWDHHHQVHPSMEYLYTFLRELGFAFIIAWALTMGIERTSRDRHNKHFQNQLDIIKRNVFEAVYCTRQDPSVVQMLETEILGHPFFRTQYEVEFVMDYIDMSGERVLRADIKVRYRMNNVTNKDQDAIFRAVIEKPYSKALADEAVMKSLTIDGKQLSAAEIKQSNDALADTPDFRRYSRPFLVKANSYSDVVAEYTVIKYCRDNMVWQVFDPCDSFKLTVFHPIDLIIYGDVIHSFPGEKSGGGLNDKIFNLRISRPLFPNNGVQFWWCPAGQTPAQTSLTDGEQGAKVVAAEQRPTVS